MTAALCLFGSVGVVLALFTVIAGAIEWHRGRQRKAARRRHPSTRLPRLQMTPEELARIRPATRRTQD